MASRSTYSWILFSATGALHLLAGLRRDLADAPRPHPGRLRAEAAASPPWGLARAGAGRPESARALRAAPQVEGAAAPQPPLASLRSGQAARRSLPARGERRLQALGVVARARRAAVKRVRQPGGERPPQDGPEAAATGPPALRIRAPPGCPENQGEPEPRAGSPRTLAGTTGHRGLVRHDTPPPSHPTPQSRAPFALVLPSRPTLACGR